MATSRRFGAFRDHVAPRPPPAAHPDRVVYGLTQPLLGIRMLVTNRRLLQAALIPVGLLAVFCAAIALLGHRGDFLRRFYTAFAVLAPLPSIVLAAHYARLAVAARHAFGFPRAQPCIEPLRRTLGRAIKQAVLIAIAIAPVSALLHLVPGTGWLLVKIVAAAWALHWVVVEAFDAARVLHPGETLADLDAAALRIRAPWYVRWLFRVADRSPIAGNLLRRFARLCDRLSMPWREEIALVEDHPALVLGFALSTAALLAVPVLNLAFRPIVIIAACHILGQLEPPAAARGPEAPADVSAPAPASRSP